MYVEVYKKPSVINSIIILFWIQSIFSYVVAANGIKYYYFTSRF